jgi:hypothetical protein
MTKHVNSGNALPDDVAEDGDGLSKPYVLCQLTLREPQPGLELVRQFADFCEGRSGPVFVDVGVAHIAPLIPASLRSIAAASIVWLPTEWRHELPTLARTPLDVANYITPDLMHSKTCVSICGSSRTVKIDARGIDPGPCPSESGVTPLVLVFVCGSVIYVTRHDLTFTFFAVLQCATVGSGENYRPHALYTDAELRAARTASGAHPDAPSRVADAEVMTLKCPADCPAQESV